MFVRTAFVLVAMAGLAGSLSASGGPSSVPVFSPEERARRTQRLYESKWGVFNHFISGDRGIKTAEAWNAAVDRIDVERVADQVKDCGAGFYFLTIEQCTRFLCAPNATFDRLAGTKPGEACSRRDLPREMAEAMKRRGIDFYLYFTGDGPANDREIAPRFGCDRLAETGVTPDFVAKWASVLEEYACRYGRDVKGWWFDGMYRKQYRYTDALMEPFHRAVLKGNPEALVGMNNGVQACNYDVNYVREDFTAGEFNDFRVIPRSRFVGTAQAFTLIPLGKAEKEWNSWSRRGCKRDAAFVADYVSLVNRAGGVVAIDVYLNDDGSFEPDQLEVLRAVGRKTGTLAPRHR